VVVAIACVVAAPPETRAAPVERGAGTAPAPGPRAAVPGEDDDLYSCRAAKGDVKVSFKPGIALADLVTWAMSFTCKTFVYAPRLASRALGVTVMAPRPMSSREAWRLFVVALQAMDLTVVPKGRVLEIVESATARKRSLPVLAAGAEAPSGEEPVRALFRPRAATSANLAQALTPLLSSDGEIVDLAWASVVLVTDRGSHIARMRELIEAIDKPGSEQILYFLPVRHAVARELVETVRALTAPAPARPGPGASAAAAGTAPAVILADERTNAIILLATADAYERTRALVERLDIDVEGGSGPRVHVHFLEHTDAEKMAATLGDLLGQRGTSRPAPGRSGPGERPSERPTDRVPDRSIDLQGEVRVTADPLSNAILVLASDRDDLALQEILRRIDRPRDQVYIEALVIEVNSGWSRTLGAAWHGGRVTRDAMWMGALGGPLSSIVTDKAPLQPPVGFLGGVIGQKIPGAQALLGTSIPSFTVLFQALAHSRHVDILSAPHVMTTDHVEANLSSGDKIPFQTGITGLAGTAGGAVGQVERQDVGLTFKVTPHVGASGRIRLDIDLSIEDVLPERGPFGPSTSQRRIVNSVVVGDQESAILGGLVTRKVGRRETKIPLLGDLPVLGALFRQRETFSDKADLVVLITPYIITDSIDGARSVERVLEGRAEFLAALERLDAMGLRARPDRRRMRGLVAEIALRVGQVEEEKQTLRELERRAPVQAGPIVSTP
jgi:general secretion pathway protein D